MGDTRLECIRQIATIAGVIEARAGTAFVELAHADPEWSDQVQLIDACALQIVGLVRKILVENPEV